PAMSDLSELNPTPHAIAVYASRPLSPGVTQHSLPSGRCPLLGPVFHRLGRTSLPGALIRSPRRRGQAALATATAVSPLQARQRTHCDFGKISAGAVQSFGTISTINTRVGRVVLFCAVCARFPVSKK